MKEAQKRAYLHEEMAADACFDVLSNDAFLSEFCQEKMKTAEGEDFIRKIADFFVDLAKKLRQIVRDLAHSTDNAIVRELIDDEQMLSEINKRFKELLDSAKAVDNSTDGARFSKEYQEAEVNAEIVALVDKVNTGQYKANEGVIIGVVSDDVAAELQKLTGVNVAGFEVKIEARQIYHIIKDHGPNGRSDHSMADSSDIAKIGYALTNPDDISYAGKTQAYSYMRDGRNRTSDTVLYEKIVGNKSYYVVEAVADTKAKTLYIVSAFIGKQGYKKGSSQLINANGPNATPKDGSVVNPIDSIPENGENVNGKSAKNQRSLETAEEIDKADLLRENEILREQVEYLRGETRLTDGATLDRGKLFDAVKGVLKGYDGSIKSDVVRAISDKLLATYGYLRNGIDPAALQVEIYREAEKILSASGRIEGAEEYSNEEKSMRTTLRKVGITLDEEQIGEIAHAYGGMQEFRKMAIGHMTLRKEGGMPLDSIWESEVVPAYPELRDVTSSAEMPIKLFEAMRASTEAKNGAWVNMFEDTVLCLEAVTDLTLQIMDGVMNEQIARYSAPLPIRKRLVGF